MFDSNDDEMMVKRNTSLKEIDVSRNDIVKMGKDFKRVSISRLFKI